MTLQILLAKTIRHIVLWSHDTVWKYELKKTLSGNSIQCNLNKCLFLGEPQLDIRKDAQLSIGDGFVCRSGIDGIGNSTCSKICIDSGAQLSIGENTGISNTVIQCYHKITIGNNVNIGDGVLIFDSDFHSLNWKDRLDHNTDKAYAQKKEVMIGDNVFIGTRSIISKGVYIGSRSIIAAGSIVTTDIPEDEIWGGCPAKFIKKIL